MVYKSIDHRKLPSVFNWNICLTAGSGSFLNFGWVVNILVIISTDSDSFVLYIVLGVPFRQRLHERGFKSSLFHSLETASKTILFQSVCTLPISPFSST